MIDETKTVIPIPRALESYPSAADHTLASELAMRVQIEPFNALATGVFLLAILHTFATARFTALAHAVQHRHDKNAQALQHPLSASLQAEVLHFFGKSKSYLASGPWCSLRSDHNLCWLGRGHTLRQ